MTTDGIEAYIQQLARTGAELDASAEKARQEAEAAEEAEAQAKRDEAWHPIVDLVKGVVPEQLHQYLHWPANEMPTGYLYNTIGNGHYQRTLTLTLPGATVIEISIADDTVWFSPRDAMIVHDDEYGYYVRFDLAYRYFGKGYGDTQDIAVAVFRATEMGKKLPDLHAEIRRRSEDKAGDEVAEPVDGEPDFLAQAKDQYGNAGQDLSAIAAAMIAQTEALTQILAILKDCTSGGWFDVNVRS